MSEITKQVKDNENKVESSDTNTTTDKSKSETTHNNEHLTAQELIDLVKNDVKKFKEEKRRIILLCVDSSKNSINAAKWSSGNMLQQNDVVILFTVWEEGIDLGYYLQPDPLAPLMLNPSEIAKNNLQHLNQARKLLHSIYNNYLKNYKVINLLISTSTGNNQAIGATIIDTSKQFDVDYIIVGSRGLGILSQFFMGSVSKYVVEHSTCPVLIVKESQ